MKCVCAGCAFILGAWAALAQTKAAPEVSRPGFAAHLSLRQLETDHAGVREMCPPAPLRANAPASETPLNASLQFQADGDLSDFHQEVFRRMDREGYFERPVRPSDSPVQRWAEGTFGEEEVKLGKSAKVSCSLYTAVKRKNPLCLLNPLFFHLSW